MVTFWIVAAALLAAALIMLTPSFFRGGPEQVVDRKGINVDIARERLRDMERELEEGIITQEQFEQARREVELELLDDVSGEPDEITGGNGGGRLPAVLVAVLVPVMAIGLYLALGDMRALDGSAAIAASHPQGKQPVASVEEMIAKLAKRMETDPDNAEGWIMLGRSYQAVKDYPQAARAYREAYRILGDQAPIMTDYAAALALSRGNKWEGKPADLVEKALSIDPDYPDALWVGGVVAVQSGDLQTAVDRWRRLASILPADYPVSSQLQRMIAQAEEKLGIAPATQEEAGAKASAGDEAAAPASIQVTVTLDPGLVSMASPEDTVFIFARAIQGPPMPLAAVRKQVKDLPVTVTLDDSMAMVPAMKMSNFKQVTVGARVSKSGNAMPQAGDLQGLVSPVSVTAGEPVQINIDEVRP